METVNHFLLPRGHPETATWQDRYARLCFWARDEAARLAFSEAPQGIFVPSQGFAHPSWMVLSGLETLAGNGFDQCAGRIG